jgi:biopolymer transport protein ExbB/TolQ
MNATDTVKTFQIGDILRQVSRMLEKPVIFLLICGIALAIFLLGWLIGEYFTERRHLKVCLPELLEQLRAGSVSPRACIEGSKLLKRQKTALLELLNHPDFSDSVREALAVRLMEEQQMHYDRLIHYSELLARLAPMFGLMGTLIPLGPGIIALGQGDTQTLSNSLLTAFDTTVAGLASAAVASVVSMVRRSWYKDYMSMLETVAECVLETEKNNDEKTDC